MVEALRIVRAMVRGEQPPEPAIFAGRADAHLDFPHPRQIPVYVGAVNARMLEAAGEWADGVQLGAAVSPRYVRWARERIKTGAERAERDPMQLDLASNVLVSVGRDATVARNAVREVLAYYIHRVENVVLQTSGADPEELQRIGSAVRHEGVAAAAGLVSDAIIDTFAAAGTPNMVVRRLHEYVAAGLEGVLAWHVLGPDRGEALRLLAEEVRPALS
jgi:5,10-methylenetetrahydromethanopterin reductase